MRSVERIKLNLVLPGINGHVVTICVRFGVVQFCLVDLPRNLLEHILSVELDVVHIISEDISQWTINCSLISLEICYSRDNQFWLSVQVAASDLPAAFFMAF